MSSSRTRGFGLVSAFRSKWIFTAARSARSPRLALDLRERRERFVRPGPEPAKAREQPLTRSRVPIGAERRVLGFPQDERAARPRLALELGERRAHERRSQEDDSAHDD